MVSIYILTFSNDLNYFFSQMSFQIFTKKSEKFNVWKFCDFVNFPKIQCVKILWFCDFVILWIFRKFNVWKFCDFVILWIFGKFTPFSFCENLWKFVNFVKICEFCEKINKYNSLQINQSWKYKVKLPTKLYLWFFVKI